MRGLAPAVIGVAVVVLLALLGAFLASGGLGGVSLGASSPSVKEIVDKDMGYACEWNGTLETYLGTFDVYGRYYFHGRRLRFEEKGLMGKTIVVDPDITKADGNVYQWAVLSEGSKPALVVTFSKAEKSPKTFEEILRIVYTRQGEPFEKVLRETLEKAGVGARFAKFTLKSVKCGPWTPNDSLFQPPKKRE